MAANHVQPGEVTTVTSAPYTVTSGQGMKSGMRFGVALTDITIATEGEIARSGVWDLTAETADTATEGAAAYWDDTTRKVTNSSTASYLIGTFEQAKTGGQTTARVRINGMAV